MGVENRLANQLKGIEHAVADGRGGTRLARLRATIYQVRVDNVLLLSAGVAFYAMLALVPALVAAVSLYGLVVTRAQVSSQIASLTTTLPPSAQQLVSNQLRMIAATSHGGLQLSLVVSLAVSLWSASSAMRWLLTALTAASGEVETRNFFKLRGLALLLTLGAIIAIGITFGVLLALPPALDRLGLEGVAAVVVAVVRYAAVAALMATALELLYRIGPIRPTAPVRWLSWGSYVAAAVWLLGSVGLSIYATHASKFQAAGTYGALGAVVVLLLWLWMSSFAVILGGVVNVQMASTVRRQDAPAAAPAAVPEPAASRRAAAVPGA